LASFSEIVEIIQGEQRGLNVPDQQVHQLFYDTRLIANGKGGLFFAFSGLKEDGHRFIQKAFGKGVNQWVISDPEWAQWLENKGSQNWVLVKDVLQAFQTVACQHRSQFSLPVVAITGSNGKTIVKEWLSQLLGSDFFICKSPKSFNSQIGVGLSLWNLSPGHTLGIFEAGISHAGEMKNLRRMILPDYGILTSLGPAHEEGFASIEEKLIEKISLFSGASVLILSESLFFRFKDIIVGQLPKIKIQTWKWQQAGTEFIHHFNGMQNKFELPFSDVASLENIGNSISTSILLNVSIPDIQNRLHLLSLPEMRLSLKEGINNNILIDDSYTNDLAGLEAALQFATLQRKAGQDLVLIISDLQESLLTNDDLNDRISTLSSNFNVSKIVTIGQQFSDVKKLKISFHRNFKSTIDLVQSNIIIDLRESILLIKGARIFGLETLVKAWQKKVHGTRLEINLDAMVNNLNFYKSQLPQGTGIMAMVKALGYGSGGEEIARILEFHHVDYLAVAYADEGVKLRESGIMLPIMVMNPMPESLQSIFDHNLEPEIYGFRILNAWIEILKYHETKNWPSIHIKIETGMHRLGFFVEELPALCVILQKNLQLKVATVFSHLAGADDDHLNDYSLQQIETFEQACLILKEKLNQNFRKHILNSAGILRFPQANYDLVRLGIGLYGIEVNSWFQNQLQPVSTFKTTISQIKKLKAGQTVGYGRQGKLLKDSEIATIAIGYADGFKRDFSKGAANVKVKDQWVPVVGNVCMDMTMIDVTGINAEEGDEVIIFDDAESLMKISRAAETIPYEILTGIGHRVKRIFFRG